MAGRGRPKSDGPALSIQDRGSSVRVQLGTGRDRTWHRFDTRADAEAFATEVRAKHARARAKGIDVARLARVTADTGSPWPTLRLGVPEVLRKLVARGDLAGSTLKGYLNRLDTHVMDASAEGLDPEAAVMPGELVGDLTPERITVRLLGNLLDTLRTPTAERRGLGYAAQQQIKAALGHWFGELRRKHAFPGGNPATHPDLKDYMSKAPKKHQAARPGAAPRHFEPEELALLLDTCAAAWPHELARVACMALGGLRYGEATALHRSDVDLRRGELRVSKSWSDKLGAVKAPKNGLERRVPLVSVFGPRLRTLLVAQLARTEGGTLLNPNRAGQPLRHGSFLEHVWQPLLAKAGLPYRNIHALRHTFGTLCAEKNVPMPVLKDWLGHATIEQTMAYYHGSAALRAQLPAVDVLRGLSA